MHKSLSALTTFSETTALRAENSPKIAKPITAKLLVFLHFRKFIPTQSQLIDQFRVFLSSKYKKFLFLFRRDPSQPAFTCSKITIETLEQGVKYVQS